MSLIKSSKVTKTVYFLQDMVYKKTGWRVPVVVLENEPPPDTRRGDWTMLPDRTLQPKYLTSLLSVE